MNKDMQELVVELTSVLNRIIDARVAEQIKPLEEELQLVKSLQSEWVDTKEAKRITGIKQAQTLKAERERPDTVLVYKIENKRTIYYLRTSLIEYSKRKIRRPRPRGLRPPGNL